MSIKSLFEDLDQLKSLFLKVVFDPNGLNDILFCFGSWHGKHYYFFYEFNV